MRYILAFLTMRGREAVAARTLASFNDYVSPEPTETFVHVDGTGPWDARVLEEIRGDWSHEIAEEQRGFCGATGAVWDQCDHAEPEWVFWLEDDFEFVRPLDLRALAGVMDLNVQVSQMALYRTPYSDEEHEIGGYLNTPGRSYERRSTNLLTGVTRDLGHAGWAEWGELPWYEHRHYWTTNPSLFRRSLTSELVWPESDHCEGQFGFEVRAAIPEASFGVWGAGSFWVDHIGIRSGTGY